MRKAFYLSLLLAGMFATGLSGCTTTGQIASATTGQSIYPNEEFTSTNIFSHTFIGSGAATCEAARRALLSQGYVINEAKDTQVSGRKNFQPENDVHMQIQFNVVCAPDSKGSNTTTAFANAVSDRYTLKKSTNSASLGVSVLGSVSLPFGYSDDSLVKVASETIAAKQFYERFYELVERYLDPSAGADEEPESTDGMDKEHAADHATQSGHSDL